MSSERTAPQRHGRRLAPAASVEDHRVDATTGRRFGGSRPLRQDYATTLLTEISAVVAGLYIFREVARRLGPDGFGDYQLARSAIAVGLPLLLLGCNIALPRFVSHALAAGEPSARSLLRPAVRAIATFSTAVVILVVAFRTEASTLLFGRGTPQELIATLALLVSLALDASVYAYLRGLRRPRSANILRGIDFVVLPLVAVATSDTVPQILGRTAVGVALVATSWLLAVWPRHVPAAPRPDRRAFASFALSRLPGELLSASLLSIPAVLAVNLTSLAAAGYVGFATSVIRLVSVLFASASYVLLPHLSGLIGAGHRQAALDYARRIPHVCALGATAFCLPLAIAMPMLIRLYLGPRFQGAVGPTRLMLLGAIPVAVYVGSRSTLDAFSARAFNSRNLLLAVVSQVALTMILAGITNGLDAVVIAFVCSTAILGIATVVSLQTVRSSLDAEAASA